MVDRFYSYKSSADKGNLCQLKELINRTSFGSNPKNNMKATESFLEVILYAHIITASKEFMLNNNNIEAVDVHDVAQKISAKFVKLTIPPDNEEPSHSEVTEKDLLYAYAVDLLTISLLWYGFRDAVREGDSRRIVRYWKFLLVVFRVEKHYNYANEGFNFLAQTVLLSPRQACEALWSRTVSMSGMKGKKFQ